MKRSKFSEGQIASVLRQAEECTAIGEVCRDAVLRGRRVFAERFDADMLAPWAQRTPRSDHIVQHLGLALSG
jgi:hypothetical protein